jgi:hypothetical protein
MATPGDGASQAARVVTGLFEESERAENAYKALVDMGYDQNDIGIVLSDDARERLVASGQSGSPLTPLEGASVGGAIGGAMGALLGAIALGTAIAIPGLGLAVAGPIVAALAGAGAGGISGGLVGGLVAIGLSEEAATDYVEHVHAGKILMSVAARDEDDARAIRMHWEQLGADAVRG